MGAGGPFELIPISSDEEDLRILGFEIFQSGFSWVGKFRKYFFACPHLGRDFLGIRNNLKIAIIVPRAFAVRVVPGR